MIDRSPRKFFTLQINSFSLAFRLERNFSIICRSELLSTWNEIYPWCNVTTGRVSWKRWPLSERSQARFLGPKKYLGSLNSRSEEECNAFALFTASPSTLGTRLVVWTTLSAKWLSRKGERKGSVFNSSSCLKHWPILTFWGKKHGNSF